MNFNPGHRITGLSIHMPGEEGSSARFVLGEEGYDSDLGEVANKMGMTAVPFFITAIHIYDGPIAGLVTVEVQRTTKLIPGGSKVLDADVPPGYRVIPRIEPYALVPWLRIVAPSAIYATAEPT